MMRRLSMFVLILLICSAANVFAADDQASATVTYVTTSQIYIDAGSDNGVVAGDTVTVMRGPEEIARAVVAFTAANSSSITLVPDDADVEVQTGDRVSYSPARVGVPPVEDTVEEPDELQPADQEPQRTRVRQPRAPEPNELNGRISTQLRFQTDDETGHDVVEPGAAIRLRIRNLWSTSHTFELRARTRRTLRDSEVPDDLRDEWNNRVYEMSLIYDSDENPLGYRAGRIYANRISGVGAFDGALVDYNLGESWAVGAFGGLKPDPRTSRINSDNVRTGVYVSHERGDWSERRIAATLALAGSYSEGEIDEEFIYQQLRWSNGRKLVLYESAELAINRGWRKDAEGSSLTLDNILLNARWSPMDDLSLNLGYDNRQILRTFETRDTPDSLFDDAGRQGWRLGVMTRLPADIRLSAQANLRSREGADDQVVTGHFTIGQRRLFGSRISGNARLAVYDTEFSTGYQPSLSFSSYAGRRIRLSLEGGARVYEFNQNASSQQDTLTDIWFRPGVSATLSSHVYVHGYGEITRGDMQTTNRWFVEAGWRF